MRAARVALVALSALVFAACPATSHRAADATSTIATTSSTVGGEVPDCVSAMPENSASTYDPAHGFYATYLKAVDAGTRQVTFDVIQWLTGDAANRAYARDSGDTSGAPNDYYIVNASPKTYVARAAPDAGVRMLTGGGTPLRRGSLADLAVHLGNERTENSAADRTYWITINGGLVTDICEQYRP